MKRSNSHSALLPRGSLLRIEARAGECVACLRGMLWLTQEHDPLDRIVAAGETFVFDRSGIALLNALAHDAVVSYAAGAHCTITRTPATGQRTALSLAAEIGRIRPRYDPATLIVLPATVRRTTVEREARRMRAQALWLVLQHARGASAQIYATLSGKIRVLLARAGRASAAKRARVGADRSAPVI